VDGPDPKSNQIIVVTSAIVGAACQLHLCSC
jgi:hypothetical protein